MKTHNMVDRLRRAAHDTASSNSKPPIKPEQTLFWKAAEELETAQRVIRNYQESKTSYISTPGSCVSLLTQRLYEMETYEDDLMAYGEQE